MEKQNKMLLYYNVQWLNKKVHFNHKLAITVKFLLIITAELWLHVFKIYKLVIQDPNSAL